MKKKLELVKSKLEVLKKDLGLLKIIKEITSKQLAIKSLFMTKKRL